MTESIGCGGSVAVQSFEVESEAVSLTFPDPFFLPSALQTVYSAYPPTASGPDSCRISTRYGTRVSMVSGWRTAAKAATVFSGTGEPPGIAVSACAKTAAKTNMTVNCVRKQPDRYSVRRSLSVIRVAICGENCVRWRHGPQASTGLSRKALIAI